MKRRLLWSVTAALVTNAAYSTDVQHDVCVNHAHCLNGGRCQASDAQHPFRWCDCPTGFSGSRCSKYCPFDCKNNGYCTVKPKGGPVGDVDQSPTYVDSDYQCKCHGFFVGDLCETPYVNCRNSRRCFNGGICTEASKDPTNEEGNCLCTLGFGGAYCEIPSDATDPAFSGETVIILDDNNKSRGIAIVSILLLCTMAMLCFLMGRNRKWGNATDDNFVVVERLDHYKDDCYPQEQQYELGGKSIQLNRFL